jgi:hypothetical protein
MRPTAHVDGVWKDAADHVFARNEERARVV